MFYEGIAIVLAHAVPVGDLDDCQRPLRHYAVAGIVALESKAAQSLPVNVAEFEDREAPASAPVVGSFEHEPSCQAHVHPRARKSHASRSGSHEGSGREDHAQTFFGTIDEIALRRPGATKSTIAYARLDCVGGRAVAAAAPDP